MRSISFALILATTALFGCGGTEPPASRQAPDGESSAPSPEPDYLEAVAAIDAYLRGVDSVFAPLPLMRPAEEDALRRFGNDAQLRVARDIGIPRLAPPEEIERLQGAGDLVPIEDGTYWVVRDLDYSTALGVPRLGETLELIGRRFQARLAEIGAPPLRFEITSVLRSAQDQERLREVNPNAAQGESTHEYGTTVDIAYNAFSAPLDPEPMVSDAAVLEAYRRVAHDRIGARRALEIKAILAETLQDLQDEGRIMVTLERLQPVFHLTVRE